MSETVYQLLRAGNRARDHGRWEEARDLYLDALETMPGLHHIWLQLGHARSETGDHEGAVGAYRHAMDAGAAPREAWLFIGHAYKRATNVSRAANAYLEAVKAGQLDAVVELTHLTDTVFPIEQDMFEQVIARMTARVASAAVSSPMLPGHTTVVYDLSDLVAHFRQFRLPSGIQRFQIEVVDHALHRSTTANRICCFVSGREELVEIDRDQLLGMITLARQGSGVNDRIWQSARAAFFISLATAAPFDFESGECLINLGTSWWIHNYALLIRNARREKNIRYIALVFDLVPVLASGLCVRGLAEDYQNWLVTAFDYTDLFICISESTARDLKQIATRIGTNLTDDRVEVVPLDADFRPTSSDRASPDRLERCGLDPEGYALFVSTIEGRKNHLLALNAWDDLLERKHPYPIPKLVFVGRRGWLNNEFYERLDDSQSLQANVVVIENASDDDLATLYAHCKFSLYPSLYEGWGLPVTESLCYGKIPVVADNSSLREAGGQFARYFESNSQACLVECLEELLSDDEARHAEEARIRADFVPRPWVAIAEQVDHVAARVSGREPLVTPPAPVELGTYYPLRRHTGTRLWFGSGSGESFRSGAGWHWPDETGSWTRSSGGRLSIGTGRPGERLRLFVHLRGLNEKTCVFEITSGEARIDGVLEPSSSRWSRPFTVEVPADGCLDVTIVGFDLQDTQLKQSGRLMPRSTSLGVIGFALCGNNDEDAIELLQSIITSDLEGISAYREQHDDRPKLLAPAA